MEDYLVRKHLAKLGFKFDPDELTDFEVDYLTTVGSTFSEMEEKEIKRSTKGKNGK